MDLLKGRYIGVEISAACRVNMIDEEIVRKMKEAGVVNLCFGVESGDENILNSSDKGVTIEQAIKTSDLAKKNGLKDFAYFILGHPNETLTTVKKT